MWIMYYPGCEGRVVARRVGRGASVEDEVEAGEHPEPGPLQTNQPASQTRTVESNLAI